MLLTLLELSMLPRERLMLMPSMVLMDIAVLVILVSDTLAMVMLLLLSPMLPQLSLMAILLLSLTLLPMHMLPLLMVLLLLSVVTELLLLLDPLFLMDMLPAVAMLLILSMHLMDTTVLDTLAMVTTGWDMGLDTEVLVILVLDTPDHMVLDMDILTTAKLNKRSSMANLKIISPHCNVNHLFTETMIIKFIQRST